MGRSLEEAFNRAQAAIAAKQADAAKNAAVPPAEAAAGKQRAAAVPDDWALRLLGVTPLPHAVRQQIGSGAVEIVAAGHPAILGRTSHEPAASVTGDRSSRVAACAPNQTGHRRPKGAQTVPAEFPLPPRRRNTAVRHVPTSPPRYPHLRPPRVQALPPPDEVRLLIASGAELCWTGGQPVTASVLKRPAEVGRLAQLVVSNEAASTRELVLGFDFGTSSAKVVMGDRGLKQAYAVPFRDAAGIDAFLLPARVYRDGSRYTLHGGEQAYTDIKLSLMAEPENPVRQEQAVAYLALAIREARGWLFTTHAGSYAKTRNVWTLALGQPADRATPGALTQLFTRLGRAAWSVAGGTADVTPQSCRAALQVACDLTSDAEIEVIVMPEIAAQIYGFVSSNQFDAKARNIFLLADVGAGTVDTCLFRAVPVRGSSWSFEVFTAAVEPTGVMNLHRHRVAWWQQHLDRHPQGAALSAQLDSIKLATEHQAHIPESFQHYMKGITLEFSGAASEPDREFFAKKLMRQVQGRTLYRAFSTGTLNQIDLGDVPFFLCGGGARHRFYRGLRDNLRELPGYTWLSANGRDLAIPNDLRADGLARPDFDRLSVAYGLSMLNLDRVAAATPTPRLAPEASNEWQRHYIDKDQV